MGIDCTTQEIVYNTNWGVSKGGGVLQKYPIFLSASKSRLSQKWVCLYIELKQEVGMSLFLNTSSKRQLETPRYLKITISLNHKGGACTTLSIHRLPALATHCK